MSHPTGSFVRDAGRTGRGMPSSASRDCGLAGTCLQSVVLSERIRALHGEIATIRSRLDRLDTVLSRGMAVLLANLTGMVLMLAKQFLLK